MGHACKGQEALAEHLQCHAEWNEGLSVSDPVAHVCMLDACASMGVAGSQKSMQFLSKMKRLFLS